MKSYELHLNLYKDPKLPFIINSTKMPKNHISAGANWHENVEILIIKDGTGNISLNERRYFVTAGDIIIANQNVLHQINSVGDFYYYYIIVDRSFCLANYFDTNFLLFDELIRDGEIFNLLCEVYDEYVHSEDNPFYVQAIRAKILYAMCLLCRKYSRAESVPQTDTHLLSCIKQAIGFIHSKSFQDISLDETAEFVGLSKYYFAREFHNITGYTFVSYLNAVRCEEAKRMLAETQKSVGEISSACGFSDQSYFTKVFKKHYGVLPAKMREVRI